MTAPWRDPVVPGNLDRLTDVVRRVLNGLQPLREVRLAGPIQRPVRAVTASMTVNDITDSLIVADATGAPITVTLPPAAGHTRSYDIKRLNSGANAVTVAAAGADLIDGSGTYPLTVQYENVTVQSDGVGWHIV